MTTPNVLDELEWRGLIAHSTDRDALRAALGEGSVRFYVGFDPTAPSLHMGNLVQLVTARRLQDAGHTPYILVGGATGHDRRPARLRRARRSTRSTPSRSGPSACAARSRAFVSFEGDNAATTVNNYDWTASLSIIDFLRDIGKHFPVNRMLARDTVKRRLESGISYTEFSYVLLQSMDYLNLLPRARRRAAVRRLRPVGQHHRRRRARPPRRRARARTRFATPLITKTDGTKYGKTEGGALWLDAEMLSPYAFHQFWLNVEDEKVGELLRIFTFLTREEIEDLEQQTAEKPFLRAGQKRLADEVTALVHGADEVEHAKAAAAALFGGGDLAVDQARHAGLRAARGRRYDAPGRRAARDPRPPRGRRPGQEQGRGAAHGRRGRRLPQQRAGRGPRAAARPTADLVAGSWLVLRRGKKNFAGVEVA